MTDLDGDAHRAWMIGRRWQTARVWLSPHTTTLGIMRSVTDTSAAARRALAPYADPKLDAEWHRLMTAEAHPPKAE